MRSIVNSKLPIYVIFVVILAILIIPVASIFAQTPNGKQLVQIPSWLRNTAKWWSQGQVGDYEFAQGIQYLITQHIIRIPQEILLPPNVLFNNASYPVNSTATISITDNFVNSDTTKRASITVNVTSTSDPHGIMLSLYQKQKGFPQFVTAPFKIVLTSLPTKNSVKWLHVNAGDKIFVTYKGQTTTANVSPALPLAKPVTRGVVLSSGTTFFGNSTDPMNTTQYPIDMSTVPSCIYDNQGDGLCSDWLDGTWNGNPGTLAIPYGNVIYQLPCNAGQTDAYGVPDCPDNTGSAKDVYVEIQYMSNPYAKTSSGSPNPISQRPSDNALKTVAAAFLNNPSGIPIRVHFQVDNSLDRPCPSTVAEGAQPCHIYYDLTTVPGSINDPLGTDSFFSIKNSYFGTMSDRSCSIGGVNPYMPPCGPSGPSDPQTVSNIHDWLSAKREAFHYALFIHSQKGQSVMGSSGWGEILGNDMVISMGAFTNGVGSDQEVEGTLMHELGHNLNLDHGGPVNTGDVGPTLGPFTPDSSHNCKPNYVSTMNYLYQFPYFVTNWNLGYSNDNSITLDENSADEEVYVGHGIGANTIAFGGNNVLPTSGPNANTAVIDWDRDGGASGNNQANLDNVGIPDCNDQTLEKLYSYNDWQNLDMYFWTSYNYANAMSADPEASHSDITYQNVAHLAAEMYSCSITSTLNSLPPGQNIGNLLMKNQCLLSTTYTPHYSQPTGIFNPQVMQPPTKITSQTIINP